MRARVLQTAGDLRREYVAGDADDEQFAHSGVEDALRRHARIAATENGRIGMLSLGQVGKPFPLEAVAIRLAAAEAFVPGDQPRQRLVRRQRDRSDGRFVWPVSFCSWHRAPPRSGLPPDNAGTHTRAPHRSAAPDPTERCRWANREPYRSSAATSRIPPAAIQIQAAASRHSESGGRAGPLS